MKKSILSFLILMAGFMVAEGQGRAPAGDDWKLTTDEATGMLDRLDNCGLLNPCHNNSIVIDPNNDVYKWIISRYSGVATITLEDARYRNSDEDRYKRLRGITDAAKSNVKGYKTKLVRVQLNSTAGQLSVEGTVLYYDCFTICPPPDVCLTSKN